MFAKLSDDQSNQSSAVYVNSKGINELFEAMMTALMVHKPDDHISFIRGCLEKAKSNPIVQKKKKKPLPPIASTTPIIFILSSSGGTSLCARLLERYPRLNYLLINDIANIDDDDFGDLRQYEHRYDCVQDVIEQRRLQVSGFLIAGGLEEQDFLDRWQEKLGRIDSLVILYSKPSKRIVNRNFNTLQIDLNHDFEDILILLIHHFDRIFPQTVSLFNTPIILCIDYGYRSMDHEFEMIDEEEDEKNNSFMSTLCHRLAEQLSLKYLHYEDSNEIYSKLKNAIHASMNTCSGYIIDYFPSSSNDLTRFQSEIGQCSLLIYTGDCYRTVQSSDIIEEFQMKNRAIYVDRRMEVDEIYDDLKNEILKRL